MSYMFIVSACGSIGFEADGRRQITVAFIFTVSISLSSVFFSFLVCIFRYFLYHSNAFKQKRTCSVVFVPKSKKLIRRCVCATKQICVSSELRFV